MLNPCEDSMPRKPKAVRTELLAPQSREAPVDYKRMIEEIVEKRLAEILAHKESAALQPFFQPPEVSAALKRKQTIPEQRKWTYYHDDWGCLICKSTDAPHSSLGMCSRCLRRTAARLKISMHRRAPEPGQEPAFVDSLEIARKALLPSIEKLARKRNRKGEL
jgi:hypothetical protein